MSIAMPETIAYGKVVGRFIQAVGDTDDVDLFQQIAQFRPGLRAMPFRNHLRAAR